MTKYPKGTMGYADEKEKKTWKVILTVVTLILFSITFLGVGNLYPYQWMKHADNLANVIGFSMFVISIAYTWVADKLFPFAFGGRISPFAVSLVLTFFAPVVSAGFNLSMDIVK